MLQSLNVFSFHNVAVEAPIVRLGPFVYAEKKKTIAQAPLYSVRLSYSGVTLDLDEA